MEIKIGCTGWSYDGWSGVFYPKTTTSTNWLKYYSKVFDVTEINSTYYRIPTSFMTKKWNHDTPDSFRFTAKFPATITHEKRLEDVKNEVTEFLTSLLPLQKKIFGLVIQLPPSLSFDEAKPRLEELFSYLPKNFRYPIEGRHKSWFTNESIKYLCEKNHCLVWNDIAGVDNPAPITSDYIYLRLIGDRSIPDSQFGKKVKNRVQQIQSWADKIIQHKDKISLAMIMSNNHYEGFAAATANSIRLKLGLNELMWEEKVQQTIGNF